MIYILTCLVALCLILGALWRLSAARLETRTGERDQLAKDVASERSRTKLAAADARTARRQAHDLGEALERHQAARRRISDRELATKTAAAAAAAKLEPVNDSAAAAAAAMNRARGRS